MVLIVAQIANQISVFRPVPVQLHVNRMALELGQWVLRLRGILTLRRLNLQRKFFVMIRHQLLRLRQLRALPQHPHPHELQHQQKLRRQL